jgi:hypothetical protein
VRAGRAPVVALRRRRAGPVPVPGEAAPSDAAGDALFCWRVLGFMSPLSLRGGERLHCESIVCNDAHGKLPHWAILPECTGDHFLTLGCAEPLPVARDHRIPDIVQCLT